MASTFTPNKGLEEPANGDYVNTWSTPVNADWTAIDTAFGGLTTINATAASGVVALTLNQYQPPIVEITGTLSAPVNYQLPANVGGFWFVTNATAGVHTITWSSATGAGTTVILPQGFTTLVFCDGTNVGLGNTTPGTAAGSATQVQYNSGGFLAGSPNLAFSGASLFLQSNLALLGSTSGTVTVSPAAVAGTWTLTLPTTPGTAGQFLTTDGTGATIWTGATGGVTSFSAGSTGLTPSTSVGGAIILGGCLGTAFGGTGLTGFSSGGALYATSSSVLTSGTLPFSAGGTGVATAPTNGQVLIGTGAGYALNTLTAGTGITITNSSGSITIASTASGGVTSVGFSTGSTGLIASGSPITTSGTITLSGVLNVANGGTGASSAASAQANLGVPSVTGSGASGSWGISVTGSAGSVTGTTGAGNQLLATNGFQKLPGGLLLQWGATTSSGTTANNATATFPTAFPTSVLTVFATVVGSASGLFAA